MCLFALKFALYKVLEIKYTLKLLLNLYCYILKTSVHIPTIKSSSSKTMLIISALAIKQQENYIS